MFIGNQFVDSWSRFEWSTARPLAWMKQTHKTNLNHNTKRNIKSPNDSIKRSSWRRFIRWNHLQWPIFRSKIMLITQKKTKAEVTATTYGQQKIDVERIRNTYLNLYSIIFNKTLPWARLTNCIASECLPHIYVQRHSMPMTRVIANWDANLNCRRWSSTKMSIPWRRRLSKEFFLKTL